MISCGKSQQPSKQDKTMSENGLTTVTSDFSPEETMNRVEQLLKERDFHIFTQVDHGKSAKKNGRDLNPTKLIIFGNPKTGGTGLMKENQTIGIDLPAKILVWQDDSGITHITYNSIKWLAKRHQLSDKNKSVIDALDKGIGEVSKKAAKNKR